MIKKSLVGTLETIEERVKEAKISNPSMIVIGEVVRLHKKIELVSRRNHAQFASRPRIKR